MLRCGTAVITVLACCSTALRLPHRAQTSHRARTPQPVASGFDWGAREIKRMSLMVHADEPLEAELQGLGAIGGAAGLMVGPRLLGSGVLGFILGAQLAPTLGFVEGPRGDGFRAAGWRMAVCIDRTARRTCSTWEALSEAMERSVFNKLVRQAWSALKELNKQTRASLRVRVLCRCARRQAGAARRGCQAHWESSGMSARASTLWGRTGVPQRIADFKDRAVLNARISELRAREIGRRGPYFDA